MTDRVNHSYPYQIYRLSFADGTQYVGLTQTGITRRIRMHKARPCNQELTKRLREGMKFRAEILDEYADRHQAYAAEQIEINRCQKPLNVKLQRGFRGDWRYERSRFPSKYNRDKVEGMYFCSICRLRKEHSQFYASRGRFNGCDSRCIRCASIQSRQSRKQGFFCTSQQCRQILVERDIERGEIVDEWAAG